jgi:hypothetical protein
MLPPALAPPVPPGADAASGTRVEEAPEQADKQKQAATKLRAKRCMTTPVQRWALLRSQ